MSTIDDKALKKGFRNGWILTLLGIVYILAFFFLAYTYHYPDEQVTWNMGGKPFVPASSFESNGYFVPADAGFVKGGGATP